MRAGKKVQWALEKTTHGNQTKNIAILKKKNARKEYLGKKRNW